MRILRNPPVPAITSPISGSFASRRNNLFALSVAQELAGFAEINAGFDDRVHRHDSTPLTPFGQAKKVSEDTKDSIERSARETRGQREISPMALVAPYS